MKRAPAQLLASVLLAPLRLYMRFISPALPRRCKYHPTCSAYAQQAISELGVVRGGLLAGWRLLRCNPLSDGGYDPVEARRFFKSSAHQGQGSKRTVTEGDGAPAGPAHRVVA